MVAMYGFVPRTCGKPTCDSYVDMCHVDVCHVDVCHVGVRDVDVKHEYSHMGWWTSLSGTQCFRMGRCADRTVVAGS